MGFIRKIENFRCEVCGVMVEGNGYTDHCPKCLWGKHMDEVTPGDRASQCQGLMEPVGVQTKGVGYKISYKCVVCGKKFVVESAENDNREEIIKISAGINRG